MTYTTTIAAAASKVGWWKLGETSGTTATDTVAARNGTHSGVTVNQAGVLGDASGDKAAAYADPATTSIPSNAAFDAQTGDWTIEAIVKPSSIPSSGNAFILSRQSSYALLFHNGAIAGLVRDGAGNFNYATGSTGDVSAGDAWHVAMTFVNSTKVLSVYVKGVLKGQITALGVPNAVSNPLTIGQYGDGGDQFSGLAQHVVLYNAALSAATLAAHATAANLAAPSGGTGGGGGGAGTPVPGGAGAEYQARLVVPSYYSGDIPSYDTWIAHNAPAGTIFCGFPGFRNDGQWYAGDNPAGGAGPLQTQTRQQAVVDLLARAHAKGYLCLPYIAMNGANAGTGFDGHYSDLNAVLGKIDLAYSLYPEYDGIFCDEGPLDAGAHETFMLAVVAHIHGKTGVRNTLAVTNLASYQQYSGAINYGDFVVLAETVWDSSGGFGGPYGSASSGSNFIAQPSFVDAWAKAKIVYWLCGVPNTNGMAAAARAQLYNQHNVGNIYLADQAPYFSRWASPAADPLLAEQIALAPIVSSGGGTPPPPPPLDTTAPVVSAIATVAGADPATTRTLTCTTDEAATVVVRYGTASGTYPLASDANATPTTSHSRALAGLVPGTTYHYVIDATDVTGNRSTSTDRTFATAAIVPPDTTPPAISAVAVTIPANTIAVVAWATNEPATSRVRYGTTAAYGSTTPLGDPGGVTTHTVTIIGLTPDTTYHFQVESGDPTGNVATSNDSTFTTTPPPAVVPPPDARSVTPDLIDAGSGSRTIMVTGVNFTATTVVRVNGAARATTYLDPTHVTAVLLAADTAALATLGIVVTDG
jgi:hypothetical protein